MSAAPPTSLHDGRPPEVSTLARNVSSRYVAIVVELVVGLAMLPFNVAHLGQAAYGLWMLAASITAYFSVLDLGYSGAVVRFVAHYRARRDRAALNEILSTLFAMFVGVGVVAFVVGVVIAFNLPRLFTLSAAEAVQGRSLLLLLSLSVSCSFAFAVFGGVVNGFQRYDLNNLVGTLSSVVTALVNVAVLTAGFGLVELVAATTIVRLGTLWIYRRNAYRVFPELHIAPRFIRVARLREVTMFSVFVSVSDWAATLNYSVDALVIGAFMGVPAVAVWSVAQRVSDGVLRVTNQLSDVLFPTFVDHAAARRTDRLAVLLVQSTRLSLAAVIPLGIAVATLAEPLILTWVGPAYRDSILVLQLLIVCAIVRVGISTALALLKGAGRHRFVAAVSSAMALSNLALSVVLVRRIGYAGVALGTLLPIAGGACLFTFPAACRRVGLTPAAGFATAVWPAAWPGAFVGAVLMSARQLAGTSLLGLGVTIALGVAAYLALFFFVAIGSDDRRRYLAAIGGLRMRWPLRPVSEGA
jgi:O-antigen/teichoic acid export membrane protein